MIDDVEERAKPDASVSDQERRRRALERAIDRYAETFRVAHSGSGNRAAYRARERLEKVQTALQEAITAFGAAAIAAERERCVKLCDEEYGVSDVLLIRGKP